MRLSLIGFIVLISFIDTSQANGWSGTGDLGIISTSGNTDASTINASLKLSKRDGLWKNTIAMTVLESKSDNETNAESYLVDYLGNYDLNEKNYSAFINLRYLDDKFDSFSAAKIIGLGYGYNLLIEKPTLWKMGLGAGYRAQKLDETNEDISSAILLGYSNLSHKLNSSTELVHHLRIETGSDNTFVQNILSLVVSASHAFSIRLGYENRYNSDPAAGSEKIDTLNSVSLMYKF